MSEKPPDDLSWINSLEPIELPSDFAVEVHLLVKANHSIVLEAISKEEDQKLKEIETTEIEDNEYHDTRRGIEDGIIDFYEDLRRAANNFATVALVTRVQHWLNRFANELSSKQDRGLVQALHSVMAKLGKGPADADFFQKLVDVRDSVIHGDSQASWEYAGRTRAVASDYLSNNGYVEVSEARLDEAILKATKMIEWFDEKMYERRSSQAKRA